MYYRYWTHHTIRPAHIGIRNERYKLMFLYGNKLDATGSDDTPTAPAWEFYDLRKEANDEDRNSEVMQEIIKKNF